MQIKIYDISQEFFGCQVYPDNPMPKKNQLKSMEDGGLYIPKIEKMWARSGRIA